MNKTRKRKTRISCCVCAMQGKATWKTTLHYWFGSIVNLSEEKTVKIEQNVVFILVVFVILNWQVESFHNKRAWKNNNEKVVGCSFGSTVKYFVVTRYRNTFVFLFLEWAQRIWNHYIIMSFNVLKWWFYYVVFCTIDYDGWSSKAASKPVR